MKKLAIIGAGRMACIFAQNAREMEIETHCFAWAEGAIAKDYVDFFYPISIFERDKIAEKCRNIGINGIVATTELTIAIVAYVADKLGLNGNPVATSEMITNKFRNREVTSKIKNLRNPRYLSVSNERDILKSDLEFPMILKPVNKGGKRGISVVYSKEDIHNAFEYSVNEVGDDTRFIVEEFIEGGQEYSVESLSYYGKHYIIQITEKISSGPPHCVELGHHQPADLSKDMREKVIDVLTEGLTAIGLENGACHTELKIKDNQIYLIEFNARPGGDHIAYPLTNLSTGYSYIKGIISVALNEFEEKNIKELRHKYAGVLFVTEQTRFLKPLFDVCENYEWCYKKNKVSDELTSLIHNDGYNTNYIMYLSDEKPNFESIIKCIAD